MSGRQGPALSSTGHVGLTIQVPPGTRQQLEGARFVVQAYRKDLGSGRHLEASCDYVDGLGKIFVEVWMTGTCSVSEEVYLRSVVDDEIASCTEFILGIDSEAVLEIRFTVPEAISCDRSQEGSNVVMAFSPLTPQALTHEGLPLVIID